MTINAKTSDSAIRSENYRNACQQRVLRVFMALAGTELGGLTLKEVAERVGFNASQSLKCLHNLVLANIAEQTTDGLWRLGPATVRIALDFYAGVDRATRRLEDLKSRYGA